MNVTLIPFFLAANLAHNDLDNYAPEFRFTAELEIHLLGNSTNFHVQIASHLKCRPLIDPDSLSCQISRLSARTSENVGEVDPSFLEGWNMPFNIKFDEKGVQTVTIPVIRRMLRLSAMKEIAEALSIGIDLNKVDQLPKVLTGTEKTVMGLVNTTFKIHAEPFTNVPFNPQKRKDDLNLHVIHLPEIDHNTCIVIEKSRDVANLDDIKEVLETLNKANLNATIEGYNATMYIGDGGVFRTETKTLVEVTRRGNKKETMHLRKTLRLTLESIGNATEEWPVPEETVTSELHTDFLQSNYSMSITFS